MRLPFIVLESRLMKHTMDFPRCGEIRSSGFDMNRWSNSWCTRS